MKKDLFGVTLSGTMWMKGDKNGTFEVKPETELFTQESCNVVLQSVSLGTWNVSIHYHYQNHYIFSENNS